MLSLKLDDYIAIYNDLTSKLSTITSNNALKINELATKFDTLEDEINLLIARCLSKQKHLLT